ncbi:palmitoyltransferase ZDHHC3-like [Babylonia areolata]|uniref:palmitoyltransferase ZDHHC3-like n=1 Tax=Babylonia areolata TaxID=304850 RepID=UPI003FD3A8C0
MSAVTFTETKSKGIDGSGSSHYRHNHLPHADQSQTFQFWQRSRQTADPENAPESSRKKTTTTSVAEVAVMVDCRAVCREHVGLDAAWLGHVWFVPSTCGQVCVIITWLLMVYAEFAVMVVVVPRMEYPYNIVNAVVYNVCAFLALASHIRATVTDPGAVPKGNATSDNIQKLGLKEGEVVYRCPRCVCIKPPRAHHCSVCQRCIRKMDHHCPWVNNCIGQNNQKFFILFTLYTCVICLQSFVIGFIHFMACFSAPSTHWTDSRFSPVVTVLVLVFLLFEAIAFGIFTASMLWSQLSAVAADETGIEQLKKEVARWEKQSRWMSFKSVFGSPFSLHWWSPFARPRTTRCSPHLHTV